MQASTLPADGIVSVSNQQRRRAIIATVIGNGLEWFDFTVYSFFAVIIAKLFFPTGNDLTSLLLAVATFGVGFFMRPVGGILLGFTVSLILSAGFGWPQQISPLSVAGSAVFRRQIRLRWRVQAGCGPGGCGWWPMRWCQRRLVPVVAAALASAHP